MSRGRFIRLGMMLLALLLTGCAAPQFTYVTNSSAHTYFKVPGGWRQRGQQDQELDPVPERERLAGDLSSSRGRSSGGRRPSGAPAGAIVIMGS